MFYRPSRKCVPVGRASREQGGRPIEGSPSEASDARAQDAQSSGPIGGTPARDLARSLWFKRYPASQTIVALLLALFATTAFSIDPYCVTKSDVLAIDPTATGALFICYEVLLSFAGHFDAMALLALGCLLTLPFRYVLFGRGDSWRPSVVFPALFFALCMVLGHSYDLSDTADLILSNHARVICAFISGAGWALVAHVAIYLAFECLDWLSAHEIVLPCGRYGRLARALEFILDRHSFLLPCAVLAVAWLPTFIGCMPGIFMGDSGAQIRQWFNLPNGTSSYLRLVNPKILLNTHHPVAHTALLGTCVQLGITYFNDCNAGLLIYTTLQYTVSVLAVAYAVSTLGHLGASLTIRAAVLAFFAFMPMYSNYAVLITKDVLFADALLVLLVQMAKLVLNTCREQGAEPVLWRRCDWLICLLAGLTTTFMRNGGLVFPLTIAFLTALIYLLRARKAAHGTLCAPEGSLSTRHVCRGRIAGIVAVAAICFACNWAFTNIIVPAYQITPGSKREVLSIPFQQTARFVQKHDGINAGLTEGVGDGLVTDEERAAIDKVLGYSNLARRYAPNKADAVKNCYNEAATSEDLKAYFKAWAEMFWKDPWCYVSAFVSNYYGYFYPSEKDAWVYGNVFSQSVMARPDNQLYFNFHLNDGEATKFCGHLVGVYRTIFQRVPVLSLLLSSATYVWMMVVCAVYMLRRRQWTKLALWVPLWGVLAICLIGPCNGSTYMRYLYPAILVLPFVWAAIFTKRKMMGKAACDDAEGAARV